MGPEIFVDARILGRHDKIAHRRTFVAYSYKTGSISHVSEVQAEDTDDAELHAVAFVIDELKTRLHEFTIVCDHESLVSEINERKEQSAKKRTILLKILNELKANLGITVRLLANNPAHQVFNKYMKEHVFET